MQVEVRVAINRLMTSDIVGYISTSRNQLQRIILTSQAFALYRVTYNDKCLMCIYNIPMQATANQWQATKDRTGQTAPDQHLQTHGPGLGVENLSTTRTGDLMSLMSDCVLICACQRHGCGKLLNVTENLLIYARERSSKLSVLLGSFF